MASESLARLEALLRSDPNFNLDEYNTDKYSLNGNALETTKEVLLAYNLEKHLNSSDQLKTFDLNRLIKKLLNSGSVLKIDDWYRLWREEFELHDGQFAEFRSGWGQRFKVLFEVSKTPTQGEIKYDVTPEHFLVEARPVVSPAGEISVVRMSDPAKVIVGFSKSCEFGVSFSIQVAETRSASFCFEGWMRVV